MIVHCLSGDCVSVAHPIEPQDAIGDLSSVARGLDWSSAKGVNKIPITVGGEVISA